MLAISSSDLTIYGVLGLIIIAFVILGLLKGFCLLYTSDAADE